MPWQHAFVLIIILFLLLWIYTVTPGKAPSIAMENRAPPEDPSLDPLPRHVFLDDIYSVARGEAGPLHRFPLPPYPEDIQERLYGIVRGVRGGGDAHIGSGFAAPESSQIEQMYLYDPYSPSDIIAPHHPGGSPQVAAHSSIQEGDDHHVTQVGEREAIAVAPVLYDSVIDNTIRSEEMKGEISQPGAIAHVFDNRIDDLGSGGPAFNIQPYREPVVPEGLSIEPIEDNTGGKRVSIGEQICGEVIERLLGRKVSRQVRPDFLINPETGRRLEMDLYDPVERIAIEYNGSGHYDRDSPFNKSDRDFINQIYRDDLKRKLCDDNGVYLIVVPYWVDMCTGNPGVDPSAVCLTSVPRHTRHYRIYDYLHKAMAKYRSDVEAMTSR